MSTPLPDDLVWMVDVVDRFEAAWRRGDAPGIEEFLGNAEGPRRASLLKHLLEVELELREAEGKATVPVDYESRLSGDSQLIHDESRRASETTLKSGSNPSRSEFHPSLPHIPGYEVLEVIGRGAMGVVYKARHIGLSKTMAIKWILPDASLERFNREARLIARVSSPHVVTVHDFRVLDDGQALLIMDYIDGTDLVGAMRERGGVLPEDHAVRWMSQVCDGMSAAAEQGIIHRDLKPANILIDRKGRALVADFGLARSEKALPGMTLNGSVMGTPHYMAPEQAENPRDVDVRADVYSFGATFYHALTGSPPFTGESVFSILYKHKTEPLISPASRNPQISERVCSIIERCLAKSPGDRFPSFAEIRRQLDTRQSLFSPWDMAEDPDLVEYLHRYQAMRQTFLEHPSSLGAAGETYTFPRGRRIVILTGDIACEAVDAIVSSDTSYLTMNYGVSLAIRRAAGPEVFREAQRYVPVRPGRSVVTSAGSLTSRFVFHGVTVGYWTAQIIVPSRDLISEIMASCFYHADSLQVRTIAFPLLGTGAMGFSRSVCLDTMFQFLARMFLHGLTSIEEARLVLFNPE